MQIYFVQAGSGGPIKIGSTKDLLDRISVLQTGNHEQLTLLGCVDGTSSDERAFHTRFAPHRIRGEWFFPCRELIEFIGGLPKDRTNNFNAAVFSNCDCGKPKTDYLKDPSNGYVYPICRFCLMQKDGRLSRLIEIGKTRPRCVVGPKPCLRCGREWKPLRKGLCQACSEYKRRKGIDRPI
jgi:hypothetical protein